MARMNVESLFAAAGLRCTRQRKAVYEALAAAQDHPTADDLYRIVAHRLPGMSLATVYNTLEALCRAELVRKLPGAGANGSARYDVNDEEHVHLRCRHSGEVADAPHDLSRQVVSLIPRQVLEQIEQRTGFKVSQVQIELVGEYDDAQQDETAPASAGARAGEY